MIESPDVGLSWREGSFAPLSTFTPNPVDRYPVDGAGESLLIRKPRNSSDSQLCFLPNPNHADVGEGGRGHCLWSPLGF